jgi:hypothetical protein
MFFRQHNQMQVRENHRSTGIMTNRTLRLEQLDERRVLSVSQLIPTDSVTSRSALENPNVIESKSAQAGSVAIATQGGTPLTTVVLQMRDFLDKPWAGLRSVPNPSGQHFSQTTTVSTASGVSDKILCNGGDTGKEVKDGGAGETKKGGEKLEDGDYGLSAGTNKRIREILHNLAINLRDGDQAAADANFRELRSILDQAKKDRVAAEKAVAEKAAADKAAADKAAEDKPK